MTPPSPHLTPRSCGSTHCADTGRVPCYATPNQQDTMRRSRAHPTHTLLALLAITVQLVVGFGHVHSIGATGKRAQIATQPHSHATVRDYGHADDWATGGRVVASTGRCADDATGPAPAQPANNDDPSTCPACRAIALGSMVDLPPIASVAWPQPAIAARMAPATVIARPARSPADYHPRGPPIA